MFSVERPQGEINNLLDRCSDLENQGASLYPGMTYEEGVKAGIEWVLGQTDDHPLEDE